MPSSGLLLACAGTRYFTTSTPCWSCSVPARKIQISFGCFFGEGSFFLSPHTGVANVTTAVGVPGGGPYRLTYYVKSFRISDGGTPTSWAAVIERRSGPSFQPIVLDSTTNAYVDAHRQLGFNLPSGTTSVQLTFTASVSPAAVQAHRHTVLHLLIDFQ